MPEAPQNDVVLPGTTLGRYTIVRRLGSGGMGAVYEAAHLDLKKRVAIKVLHPSLSQDPAVSVRFLREGEAAAKIRHAHVADVYDVASQDDYVYLVMELLEGTDLANHLKKEKELSESWIADLFLPIVAALQVAHDERIIHRDLKPANIFLAKGRHGEVLPKILDFGIAKIVQDEVSDTLTQSGAIIGTLFYMSPEQAHGGRDLDARSDQFSIGVILYECATGRRPFTGESRYQILHAIVSAEFSAPRSVRPDLSAAFEEIVLRAMAKDPSGRFPSVHALGAALLPLASERVRIFWSDLFGQPRAKQQQHEPAAEAAALIEPNLAPLTQAPSLLGAIESRGRRRLRLFVGAVLLVPGALLMYAILRPSSEPITATSLPMTVEQPDVRPANSERSKPLTTYRVKLEAEPSSATLEFDGARTALPFERDFPSDGREHTALLRAKGFVDEEISWIDTPPKAHFTLKPIPLTAKTPPKKPERVDQLGKRPNSLQPTKTEDESARKKVGRNQAPILH
jgi:serine/threonine-protein kinase